MTTKPSSAAPLDRPADIAGYYRLHARIYDVTRWTFLFGRDALLDQIARVQPAPKRILEIGCGTGRNLAALARRFPEAQLTGVDLSPAMLAIARRKTAAHGARINLEQRAYGSAPVATGAYDLVLCSYSLSMFNPGFEQAIAAAHAELCPGGHFALVDFHATPFRWFSRWLGANHVQIAGQLRPVLHKVFEPVADELHPAYGGLWQYLVFVGRCQAQPETAT